MSDLYDDFDFPNNDKFPKFEIVKISNQTMEYLIYHISLLSPEECEIALQALTAKDDRTER